jgi:hypothetical protein
MSGLIKNQMLQNTSYILLDAARMEAEILTARGLNPYSDSLYRGRSEENLASVAPYLYTLEKETEFRNWYFEKGWGDSWGVMVFCTEELKTVVKHFRQFLMVETEAGEELYFRFYDPRVLRIFLPTCDQKQLNDFFGPVEYFICEGESPAEGQVFSISNGYLKVEPITKEQAMRFEPVLKKKSFFRW